MARSLENKKLIKRLIVESTGFQQGEENFSICQNYVTSNLRFHRYLDVDSHKVNKTLDGIYEKFTVHSEIGTGDLLRQKVAQFLGTHEFEKKDVAETDTHFAVLSFLLEMSNCPTAVSYVPPPEHVEEEKEFDDFDWYTYLTEDLEPLQTRFSDSSSDSEESETELVSEVVCTPVVRYQDVAEQVEATTNSLRDLLVTRYWAGEQDFRLQINTDLAHNWIGHLNGLGALEAVHQDVYMTEYQMVREVLWMLSAATETFLFVYDTESESYSVRPGVNLTHTTKAALAEILSHFTEFASQLAQIRSFVSKVLMEDCPLLCRTYEAFCVACSEVTGDVDSCCTTLTKQIKTEEIAATLISLVHKFNHHRQIIHILHRVYRTAVAPLLRADNHTVSSAASFLLTACNSALNDASMQDLDSQVLLAVVRVFVKSLEPYLTIIDQWLTDGNLADPHAEFVIKKKESECLDETFWDTAVEVTALDIDAVDSPTDAFSFSRSVPDLLEGTLTRIAVTGKSMEMLSRLGKLNLAIGPHERSLHSVFIERFCTELSWTKSPGDTGSMKDTPANESSVNSQEVEKTLSSLQTHTDVPFLLAANLRALFEENTPVFSDSGARCLSGFNSCNMMNLSKTMSSSLGVLINDRYKHVSKCLLQVLKEDCKLDHSLSLIRKVYLLEAGDVMYEFWWELFDKIRHSEDWKDSVSLNISILECLEKQFPKDSFRFSISLVDLHKPEFLPIHIIEEIHLHYEVNWPIDVVYNSDCESDYNRIFQFLLQLKLAKYSMDHLKFDGLLHREVTRTEDDPPAKERPEEESHLLERDMYLLRMRMLHFVNGLHDYIMTTILYSSWIRFKVKIDGACDLEAIIKAHRVYLNEVYDRCFLHENNTVLHDCLLKILNCSLMFQQLWDSGLAHIAKAELDRISSEFNRCLQILTSFITSLIKTGSVYHLESLALTLRMATADYT